MNSWKRLLTCAAAACAAATLWAATGDSRATAALLAVKTTQQSKTVSLVEDPEWGGGVYHFKVYLKNGTGYTFWSTGSSSVSAYAGAWNSELQSINNDFGSVTASDGNNFWLKIASDDWWDPADMPSGYYYLVVSGDTGDSFTVNWQEGAKDEPIPVGSIENPRAVALSTTAGAVAAALRDGAYYFKAQLTAGKKYKFWTTGGAEANGGFALQIEPVDEGVALPLVTPVDDGDDFNQSFVVFPEESGYYQISVTGDGASAFTFNYQTAPARTPANHTGVTALGAPTTDGGQSGPHDAGARNAEGSGYFDLVIDEHLFSASLQQGAKYVFETDGGAAADGLVMEIYDAAGTVLQANRQKAPGDDHTLIAFQAPATATYWIGVCQDVEAPGAPVPFTLSYRRLAADEHGTQDAWDAGDDAYAGASALAPLPGAQTDSAVDVGEAHGPHTLGLTDWSDWFRVDARNGITYKLQAQAAGMDGFALQARVYTLSGTSLRLVQTIDDLAAGGQIAAALNGSYYVQVSVQGGQGVDYGPYTLYAMAYKAGAALGMLQVNIGGPTTADGASWSLLSDGISAPKYPGGATVLLASGAQTVKFSPVVGWATPSNQAVAVAAGAAPTVVAVNYNDTADPKDDLPAAATALTPTNKSQKRSHSLWAADAADWFRFTVKPETYYAFSLSPFTGSPRLTVFRANLIDVAAEGANAQFLSTESATYYVRVDHAVPASPADSAYTLNYLAQTVGSVKFERATYTFAEGTAAATLRVLRSGKDARVRVRYETQAGSAVPGTDYKPVKGYLEWADGDLAAKVVTVPLIPDLYAAWDLNKVFTVLIEAVPESERDAGELVPPLVAPTSAAVTITEISKKAPGKLSLSGYGPSEVQVSAFANARSPLVAVGAGQELTLWIARTDGADGAVTARVQTVQGTALSNVNFEASSDVLVWGPGDVAPRPFAVRTLTTADVFQTAKTLTAKLSILGGGALLGTSSVSVEVRDPLVAKTLEEWAAAGENTTGLTLRPSVAGAWFFDVGGNLRCAPLATGGKAELTLTAAGPGALTFASELVKGAGDNSAFTCMIGAQTFAVGDGAETLRYLPKGTQTVKFTVTRGAASPAGAEVFGRFFDLGGAPFLWAPLPAPAPTAPANLSVVPLDADIYYRWNSGHTDFRFYLADSAAKLTSAAALVDEFVSAHELCMSCGEYPSLLAGKTYYWRVDAVIPGDDVADPAQDKLTSPGPVWSFVVGAAGAPVTEELVAGALADFTDSDGEGYRLQQGLPCKIGPFAAPNGETFKATGLPAGLAVKVEGGQTYIAGIPTKTNSAVAILQAMGKSGAVVLTGATVAVPFDITPAGLAAGAFNGLVEADEANMHESLGSLSYLATEAGALSAKLLLAGKTYAFAGTGFAEDVPSLENGQPGLRSVLKLVSVVAGVTYTNTLTITACRGSASSVEAADTPALAQLELWIAAADNKSAREVSFGGQLFRDNSKLDLMAGALKEAAGYYTVALPVRDAVEGAPAGAGYATITLASSGSAKLSGVLADGTAWSASTPPGYVSSYGGSGRPAWLLPVFTAKAKMAAGGWLVIADDAVSGLPVASGLLGWYNSDTNSTRGGVEGYSLTLEPAGGYYDTLFNLQTYYLNAELTVGASGAPAALDATYTQLACTPEGLALTAAGDTLTASKRALVKAGGSATLYDFENSVNPCNLTLAFTRATGLCSGTFSLWYENAGGTLQKEQLGVKFQGVLTPVKASGSGYAGSPGLGFYAVPEKVGARTWSGSYLFEIRLQELIPDWSEGWDE